MVLRLRQAGKDLEREKVRAEQEERARQMLEGERDAATTMARQATDRLAALQQKQGKRQRRSHNRTDQEEEDEASEATESTSGASSAAARDGGKIRTNSQRLFAEMEVQAEAATVEEQLCRRSRNRFIAAASPDGSGGLASPVSAPPQQQDQQQTSLEELEQQWLSVQGAQRQQMMMSPTGAIAFEPEAEQQQQPGLIEVICPEGVSSGEHLTVEVGEGAERQLLEVEVPEGIQPGDAFLVDERAELGQLETATLDFENGGSSEVSEAAVAALEAAEARADESERELGEVMVQVGAVLQRRKKDEARMRDMEQELVRVSEREVRGGMDEGRMESVEGQQRAVADAESRAAEASAEVERIASQLAETEAELAREREEGASTSGMAQVGEAASAALLSELQLEQVARAAAVDEASRLKDKLSQLRAEDTEEVATLRQQIEQEQAVVDELQTSLSVAEQKVLRVVEETAQAVMTARAEEAATAVVSARRDFVAASEEATAKAVAAEQARLEGVHTESIEAAQAEIEELRKDAEAQTVQEREAVAHWEAQEAALMWQLEETEGDLAEVTQAYPLAIEEAKNQLAEAHGREMQAVRDDPQPEPEPDMTQVNGLLAEIAQLNQAMQDQAAQEKSAVSLWEQQEALLAKQLAEAESKSEVATAERNRLEGAHEAREEHFAAEIEKLKADVQAQSLQEKKAVALWEAQEASLLRQLEEAEGDLAELTQAYPLALEEAKASLQESHVREMEAATGVSALVEAEPAPMAEIMGDDGELEELRVEVQDLHAMDEQRCEQVARLEQAAREVGQELDAAHAEYAALQTKQALVESAFVMEMSVKDEAGEAVSEELTRAKADLTRATEAASAVAETLDATEGRVKELEDSLDVAHKEAAGLAAQHQAAMGQAEAAYQQAIQKADAANAAELAALWEAHAVELPALRSQVGTELADVAEAAETELNEAHEQEIKELRAMLKANSVAMQVAREREESAVRELRIAEETMVAMEEEAASLHEEAIRAKVEEEAQQRTATTLAHQVRVMLTPIKGKPAGNEQPAASIDATRAQDDNPPGEPAVNSSDDPFSDDPFGDPFGDEQLPVSIDARRVQEVSRLLQEGPSSLLQGELEELRVEVQDLHAMDEQRCEQVARLEQAAREVGQELDAAHAEYAALQTKQALVESAFVMEMSVKDEAGEAVSEELTRAKADLTRATEAASAVAETLDATEGRVKELEDSLDVAHKEAAGLAAQHQAAMGQAEAAYQQAIQKADAANAAELAALWEAHAVELPALRSQVGTELADVAEAAETELNEAHEQEIKELRAMLKANSVAMQVAREREESAVRELRIAEETMVAMEEEAASLHEEAIRAKVEEEAQQRTATTLAHQVRVMLTPIKGKPAGNEQPAASIDATRAQDDNPPGEPAVNSSDDPFSDDPFGDPFGDEQLPVSIDARRAQEVSRLLQEGPSSLLQGRTTNHAGTMAKDDNPFEEPARGSSLGIGDPFAVDPFAVDPFAEPAGDAGTLLSPASMSMHSNPFSDESESSSSSSGEDSEVEPDV